MDGSRLRRIIGATVDVSCYHHQGVHTHPGFEVAALSTDGVVEAVEAADEPLYLGVQWHPETGTDARLFQALVEAAR
jgi:putative glutamine amidotransferase